MRILGREINFSLRIRRERRKAERVPLHESLFLDYYRPSDKTHGAGEGKNLSTAGILFAASSALPVGSFLELILHCSPVFALPSPLRLEGRVVRCFQIAGQQHYRLACAFESFDVHAGGKLHSFIEWIKEGNKESYHR